MIEGSNDKFKEPSVDADDNTEIDYNNTGRQTSLIEQPNNENEIFDKMDLPESSDSSQNLNKNNSVTEKNRQTNSAKYETSSKEKSSSIKKKHVRFFVLDKVP